MPRLAMDSETIRWAVLALSAASANPLSSSESPPGLESRDYMCLSEAHQSRDSGMEASTESLAAMLRRVCYFISDIPKAWAEDQDLGYRAKLPDTLSLQAAGTDLVVAVCWLSLRIGKQAEHNQAGRSSMPEPHYDTDGLNPFIELSAALHTRASVHIPFPIYSNATLALYSADMFGEMFYYAHGPLLLCARTVNFCSRDVEASVSADSQSRRNPLESWKALFEELDVWYSSRPEEFQAMVELHSWQGTDAHENAFPVILFTNGAAIFANQLYHTAMLLLLQNKPRTLGLTDRHSSIVSPLWHAQRICNIALNNDRRESWDLCLISSLLVAARCMTHESQQRAILQGFERIKALTGWDINDCLSTLREEWHLAEAS